MQMEANKMFCKRENASEHDLKKQIMERKFHVLIQRRNQSFLMMEDKIGDNDGCKIQQQSRNTILLKQRPNLNLPL